MDKVKVVICSGTACYVMGGAQVLMLEDSLPENLQNVVAIEGSGCLEYCKDRKYGKAPFVEINGEVMSEATVPKIIERINRIVNG